MVRVGYSALTERQEAEMEVAELKMSPISLGVTRIDKVRHEYIRGTLQVARLERKQEKHAWIYWENDAEDVTVRKEEPGKTYKGLWMR